VRAVEHLSNTPRQIFIAQSLGYELPAYAHIPFVAEPGSKNKLSKRKIDKYLNNKDFKRLYQSGAKVADRIGRDVDPSTFNPVLLLGWSLDGETEEFSREEMLKHFSLDRVVKSEASFDPQKLTAFQERYMNGVGYSAKAKLCQPYLQKANLVADPIDCEELSTLKQVVRAAADRINMAGDILNFDSFFQADDDFEFEEKAFNKRLLKPDQAGFLLNEFRKLLATTPEFAADELQKTTQGFCETHEIGLGDIVNALRVAVTGKGGGFGMFDTLEVLGRERCVNRIDRALSELEKRQQSTA
jgi:glutamyl-tRNA synthetase